MLGDFSDYTVLVSAVLECKTWLSEIKFWEAIEPKPTYHYLGVETDLGFLSSERPAWNWYEMQCELMCDSLILLQAFIVKFGCSDRLNSESWVKSFQLNNRN